MKCSAVRCMAVSVVHDRNGKRVTVPGWQSVQLDLGHVLWCCPEHALSDLDQARQHEGTVLEVPCPECRAKYGEWCRENWRLVRIHSERYVRGMVARGEDEQSARDRAREALAGAGSKTKPVKARTIERVETPEALQGKVVVDLQTAAKVLGIGRNTAYAAAERGEIPTFRLGNQYRVPVAKLLDKLGISGD